MSDRRLRVVTATDLQDVRPLLGAWRDLHARRLDDNVFVSPEYLVPLLQHGSADAPWMLAFVLDETDERMLGCAVFAAPALLPGTPVRVLSTWEHEMFLDATPLLDRERGAEAARALTGWLDGRGKPWSAVRWARVGLETSAWSALAAAADERGRRWWLRRSYGRAVLRPRAGFEEYLAEMPGKRRGRMRWRRNRVEREGEVSVRVHRDLEQDPQVVDRLLRLEAAGWKGEAGTALACEAGTEAFFRDACANLAARRALYFVELCIDDRPVSISANFLDGGTLFGFKSGYEPRIDSLSPGIVNALEIARLLHEDPALSLLDSCAEEDSHLDAVWIDGTRAGEVLVATGAFAGWTISLLPYVRRSRALARQAVDTARSALRAEPPARKGAA